MRRHRRSAVSDAVQAYIQTEMAQLGSAGEDQLLQVLTNTSREIKERALAASLLGLKRFVGARSILIAIGSNSNDRALEWECFWSVGIIGSKRSTRPLLRLVKESTSPQKKRAIIYALGMLRDERSRNVLIWRLLDPNENPSVRGFAAEALGLLRPKERTVKALISALSDPSVFVRFSALCAVESLRLKEATHAVAQLLDDHTVADGETTVAARAAETLALIQRERTEHG